MMLWFPDIGVNSDPMFNSPWNVWVLLFFQCYSYISIWLQVLLGKEQGKAGSFLLRTQSIFQSKVSKLAQVCELSKRLWLLLGLFCFFHSYFFPTSLGMTNSKAISATSFNLTSLTDPPTVLVGTAISISWLIGKAPSELHHFLGY